jgi:trehalose 6-phosphate synthase
MNLVSKEGPALNERDGVLVLSEGAGSFGELGDDAIGVADPLDISATAAALETAIDMSPAERKRRAAALATKARASKPGDWIEAQLNDLAAIQATGSPESAPSVGR